MVIRTVSLSTDSEIAMVPDKLCNTPILMVSAANAWGITAKEPTAKAAAIARVFKFLRRFIMGFIPVIKGLLQARYS